MNVTVKDVEAFIASAGDLQLTAWQRDLLQRLLDHRRVTGTWPQLVQVPRRYGLSQVRVTANAQATGP